MSDLSHDYEHAENHLLTRALAAHAVQFLAQTDPQSAASAVTDGTNDNGIDAIFYDVRDKRLYIIQSKWIHSGTGEPGNGEVKKFITGIKDLFNNKFERFNERIARKADTIINALNDPYSRYVIALAYTGINELSSQSQRDIQDLLEEINDASDLLTFKNLNQTALHASLTLGLTGEPITLDIGIKSWGKVDNPHIAFYGQVDGMQVFDWWKGHGTRLFAKNLRSVIGDTEVNNEIRETLETRPDYFWYFNNGVTVVARKITKTMMGGGNTDYGTFHCEDMNIVNGAQTVGTIGKSGEKIPERLEGVYIPIRIISLEHGQSNFNEEITKTNNRQNKIENRDFVTLDPEQSRIKTELAIDGIDYSVMRVESYVRTDRSFDLIEGTTALACASTKITLVVQLKREIGKLWEDIGKTPYKEIFNNSVPGLYVWRCVKIQRKIEKALEEIEESPELSGRDRSILTHGNRFISALVFHNLDVAKFKDPSFEFDVVTQDEIITSGTEESYNTLKKFIDLYFSNAIIPTLFKNLSKCRALCHLCKSDDPEEHKQSLKKSIEETRRARPDLREQSGLLDEGEYLFTYFAEEYISRLIAQLKN
jgi:hypothetical protein